MINRIDPEKPKTLKACAAAGMSQAETARHLGISRYTVCRKAKRFGLTFAHKLHREDVWAAAAGKGMTASEAATALGVTPEAAYLAAKRYGFSFRPAPRLPDLSSSELRTYQKLRDAKIPREEALRALGYGAAAE
jgi:transcriptional regulator with GAF, ATPase, and Fis domain